MLFIISIVLSAKFTLQVDNRELMFENNPFNYKKKVREKSRESFIQLSQKYTYMYMYPTAMVSNSRQSHWNKLYNSNNLMILP